MPKAPTNLESETRTAAAKPKRWRRGRKTKWNIMVYIAGDSMLSSSMISQLKEMTDAGFQKDTRVLVYFDPNCNGRGARIFNVNDRRKADMAKKGKPTVIGDGRDPYVRNVAEDCEHVGLTQIPAALSLRYFLEYSRYFFPAENYLVFLQGHGVIVGNDSFLPDVDDGSGITLPQLGWTLKNFAGKVRDDKSKFHLVAFHSCSMNSVELAYELAGSARYMIGTQGDAFPSSWPYRQLLKKIFCTIERYERMKSPDTRDRQEKLVREILTGIQDLSFYNSEDFWLAGYSADLSLCSLDKKRVDGLTGPINQLSNALSDGLDHDAALESILLAHWESQSFWGEAFSDLYDFCDRLKGYCKGASPEEKAIRKACERITGTLECKKPKPHKMGDFSRLVVYSDYYGPAYQFCHGLSIYFPWARPAESVMQIYKQYDFANRDGSDSWFKFLEKYFRKTLRRYGKFLRQPLARMPGLPPTLPRTVNALVEISDKQLLFERMEPVPATPPKPPAEGPMPATPPKPPSEGPMPATPPKPPSEGITAVAVIKNFPNPDDRILSSRPWPYPGNKRGRGASKKDGKTKAKAK
jgi:hypothetical protein